MGYAVFLIVFLTLYGTLHLYAFLKVRSAVALSTPFRAGLLIFMLLMILAPVLVRVSEKAGVEWAARLFAYVGYVWMGLLLLLVSASLVLDVGRLGLHLVGLLKGPPFARVAASPSAAFFIALGVSVIIAIYGYWEALDIRATRVVLKTPKIPPPANNLTIVQISDIHLGVIVREKRLKRILEKVKDAKPDILVSTGDLVDAQLDSLPNLAAMFRDIDPPYGAFAVTGNHEYYAGLKKATAFTKAAGFRLLRGEGVTVDGDMNIAGVDDRAGERFGRRNPGSEKSMLSTLPQDRFTLLLKHRPVVDRQAMDLFDLQLSGHVHKGQIFPFTLITKLFFPMDAGLYEIGPGTRLYVSRGSGTWGPPIRFLSPPEVVVIELVHDAAGSSASSP